MISNAKLTRPPEKTETIYNEEGEPWFILLLYTKIK